MSQQLIRLINSLPVYFSKGMIFLYRLLFSWRAPVCRYEPSCSQYALEALQKHGFSKGWYLAWKRIFSCHPFAEGGNDPVPD